MAPRFLSLVARAMAAEQASTVSDFIAARFGHDVVVARLVTIIALLGTVPYIALQFRSIGSALSIASGSAVTAPAMIATGALLAMFAMLFGARRYELAGRSEGLVYAIGLKSLIKLVALVLVAAIAVLVLVDTPAAASRGFALLAKGFRPDGFTPDFPVIMVISAMALLIVPIALAGVALIGPGVQADLYVLALPAATGHNWVLGAALVGGFSAASAMAIVDSIGQRILLVRRLSIVAVMALALPPILPAHWLAHLSGGPLDPLRLFGVDLGSPLVHGGSGALAQTSW